jgi:hypothetical protein
MKGWQNSFSARLRRTQWNMDHGLSTLNPGTRINQGPTRRFKVECAYLPPQIGFTAWRDWEFDEADARRIAQRNADSGKYRWVKLVSMTKINGRWTRYTVEEIFPSSNSQNSTSLAVAAAAAPVESNLPAPGATPDAGKFGSASGLASQREASHPNPIEQ